MIKKKYVETFIYDDILSNENSPEDVFSRVAQKPIEECLLEVKDFLLFGFGNTNSGKTFSIVGDKNQKGILTTVIEFLLKKSSEMSFLLYFQAFEIYNE